MVDIAHIVVAEVAVAVEKTRVDSYARFVDTRQDYLDTRTADGFGLRRRDAEGRQTVEGHRSSRHQPSDGLAEGDAHDSGPREQQERGAWKKHEKVDERRREVMMQSLSPC